MKITIWERYYINDEDLVKFNKNPNDIDILMDRSHSQEMIYESWEHMSPQENGNQSTTEIYDKDGNMIWSNKPIQEIRDEKIQIITKD